MALKHNILLVEDDFNLGFVVQDNLKLEGYSVHLCRDGKEGLQMFNKNEYDLCIFDVMLPHKDGFSLAQDIRKTNTQVPILFVTAKSMDEDKIKGFKSGGDDYITKPFNNDEFLLRVQAILKRTGKQSSKKTAPKTHDLGKLNYDVGNYMLTGPDYEKKLTKKEGEIMKLLCQHQDQLLERSLVLNMIWGDDNYFNGRSLDVFITKLRKYLKEDESIKIENVHGVGFKLTVG